MAIKKQDVKDFTPQSVLGPSKTSSFEQPPKGADATPTPVTAPAPAKHYTVVHNIRPEAIQFVDEEFGGHIPGPSIAINHKDEHFDGFGSIQLVAHPSLVDPKKRHVHVFSSDAYTPRAEVKWDADSNEAFDMAVSHFHTKFNIPFPGTTMEYHSSAEELCSFRPSDVLLRAYEHTPDGHYQHYTEDKLFKAFAKDIGKDPELLKKPYNNYTEHVYPFSRWLTKQFKDSGFKRKSMDQIIADMKLRPIVHGEDHEESMSEAPEDYEGHDHIKRMKSFDDIRDHITNATRNSMGYPVITPLPDVPVDLLHHYHDPPERGELRPHSELSQYIKPRVKIAAAALNSGEARNAREAIKKILPNIKPDSKPVQEYIKRLARILYENNRNRNPKDYLEAKILRPVHLSEFHTVIYDDKTPQEVVDILRDKYGLQTHKSERGVASYNANGERNIPDATKVAEEHDLMLSEPDDYEPPQPPEEQKQPEQQKPKYFTVVHNINPGAIQSFHEMYDGHIPGPSLALVNENCTGFKDRFGSVSLIAHPTLVDPKKPHVHVFSSDAWTPRSRNIASWVPQDRQSFSKLAAACGVEGLHASMDRMMFESPSTLMGRYPSDLSTKVMGKYAESIGTTAADVANEQHKHVYGFTKWLNDRFKESGYKRTPINDVLAAMQERPIVHGEDHDKSLTDAPGEYQGRTSLRRFKSFDEIIGHMHDPEQEMSSTDVPTALYEHLNPITVNKEEDPLEYNVQMARRWTRVDRLERQCKLAAASYNMGETKSIKEALERIVDIPHERTDNPEIQGYIKRIADNLYHDRRNTHGKSGQDYLEAKILRPVHLSEFHSALVGNDTPQQIRDILQNEYGLKLYEKEKYPGGVKDIAQEHDLMLSEKQIFDSLKKDEENASQQAPAVTSKKPKIPKTKAPGTFVVQHNLTGTSLAHIDEEYNGHIPGPSLAITKNTRSVSEFGEISLIAHPSMVNPKNPGVHIFTDDAYTPRVINRWKGGNKDHLAKLLNLNDDHAGGDTIDILLSSAHGPHDTLYRHVEYDDYGPMNRTASKIVSAFALDKGIEPSHLKHHDAVKKYLHEFSGWLHKQIKSSGYSRLTAQGVVDEMKKRPIAGGEFEEKNILQRPLSATSLYHNIKKIKTNKELYGFLNGKIPYNGDIHAPEIVKNFIANFGDTPLRTMAIAINLGQAKNIDDAFKQGAKHSNAIARLDPKNQEVRDYISDLATFLYARRQGANLGNSSYLEAKILRPVHLSEFHTAVVSPYLNQDYINILEKHGIRVRRGSNNEGSYVGDVAREERLMLGEKPSEAPSTPAPTGPQTHVVQHSMTPAALFHIDSDYDGKIPGPSIAVVKKNRKFNDFGDISLIAHPNLINPEADPAAHIFSKDAYTSRAQNTWEGTVENTKHFLDKMGVSANDHGEYLTHDARLRNNPPSSYLSWGVSPDLYASEAPAMFNKFLEENGLNSLDVKLNKEKFLHKFTKWHGDHMRDSGFVRKPVQDVVSDMKQYSVVGGELQIKDLAHSSGTSHVPSGLRRLNNMNELYAHLDGTLEGTEVPDDSFKVNLPQSVKNYYATPLNPDDTPPGFHGLTGRSSLIHNVVLGLNVGEIKTARDAVARLPGVNPDDADFQNYIQKLASHTYLSSRNPEHYLEAKVLRPVGLSEFHSAYISPRVPQEAIDILKKHGLNVHVGKESQFDVMHPDYRDDATVGDIAQRENLLLSEMAKHEGHTYLAGKNNYHRSTYTDEDLANDMSPVTDEHARAKQEFDILHLNWDTVKTRKKYRDKQGGKKFRILGGINPKIVHKMPSGVYIVKPYTSKEGVSQRAFHAAGLGDLHQSTFATHYTDENGAGLPATVVKVSNAMTLYDYKKQEGRQYPHDDWAKLAIMDFALGQGDRHTQNVMVQDGTGRPLAIDNEGIKRLSQAVHLQGTPVEAIIDQSSQMLRPVFDNDLRNANPKIEHLVRNWWPTVSAKVASSIGNHELAPIIQSNCRLLDQVDGRNRQEEFEKTKGISLSQNNFNTFVGGSGTGIKNYNSKLTSTASNQPGIAKNEVDDLLTNPNHIERMLAIKLDSFDRRHVPTALFDYAPSVWQEVLRHENYGRYAIKILISNDTDINGNDLWEKQKWALDNNLLRPTDIDVLYSTVLHTREIVDGSRNARLEQISRAKHKWH